MPQAGYVQMPQGPTRVYKSGAREVHRTRTWQVQGPGKVPMISFSVIKPKIISVSQLFITINTIWSICTSEHESSFSSLYKQAIKVSTRAQENKEAQCQSSYPLVKFLSEALSQQSRFIESKIFQGWFDSCSTLYLPKQGLSLLQRG